MFWFKEKFLRIYEFITGIFTIFRKIIVMRNIPGINFGSFKYTLALLKTAQKEQKMQNCMVGQAVCGLCRIFEEEGIFVVWLFSKTYVFIFKPELIEPMSKIIDKSSEYEFFEPAVGKGLATSNGAKWKKHRKLLTPAFHFQILQGYMPIFKETTRILIEKMKHSQSESYINIVPLIKMYMLDVICKTAMGIDMNIQHNPDNEYIQAILTFSDVVVCRICKPWYWMDSIFMMFQAGKDCQRSSQIMINFAKKVIKEKKDYLLKQRESEKKSEHSINENSSQKKCKTFLDLVLELHLEDPSFTEENLIDEVNTFILVGHDTTALTLCWTLYNIGLYPEIQENVFKELMGIYKNDKMKEMTFEDLKKMTYIERVIKETLRLFPTGPAFFKDIKNDITVGDYTIASGTTCGILPITLHRNSKVYENPEVFDPDRFLPENVVKRHSYAYIPFSAGPRNCIGQKFAMMELKVAVAYIIRNFKIRSLDPMDKIILNPSIVLKSANPLRIQLISR